MSQLADDLANMDIQVIISPEIWPGRRCSRFKEKKSRSYYYYYIIFRSTSFLTMMLHIVCSAFLPSLQKLLVLLVLLPLQHLETGG